MSKPKGRRKPLHSEITSLRPAPDSLGPDSSLESEAPAAAEAELSEQPPPRDRAAEPSDEPAGEESVDQLTAQNEHALNGAASSRPDAGASEESSVADDSASEELAFEELGLRDNGERDGGSASELSTEARMSLLHALDQRANETADGVPNDAEADDPEAFLTGLIEALLFTSQKPLPLKELARVAGIDRPRARELVEKLSRSYATRGVCVEEVAGGYAMRSSPRYAPHVQKFLALRPIRLSRAQLETLAIVAYRQPVTKPEVDDIRGVDSGQVLKGLMDRNLLKILGKKDEPGRPMLYGTTNEFLELLNLRTLGELPTLREYTELSEESQRKFAEETGEAAPADPVSFAAREAGPDRTEPGTRDPAPEAGEENATAPESPDADGESAAAFTTATRAASTEDDNLTADLGEPAATAASSSDADEEKAAMVEDEDIDKDESAEDEDDIDEDEDDDDLDDDDDDDEEVEDDETDDDETDDDDDDDDEEEEEEKEEDEA
jgi:segregation and condensation protein B